MAMLDPDLTDVHAALDVIESASKLPARSRATNVGPFIEDIIEHSNQYGLRSAELKRVVDVLVAKNELDQTSRTTLLRNLIPADRVPSSVVLALISALGQGPAKPPAAVQTLLIRWITAVHEVLEDPAFLLRLYAVLFNFLDLISIRVALCQLLGLLTRRKHVRPFRIARLLTLCQQFANESALVALLRVYKNFCPEIVISQTIGVRPAQSPFDSEWRTRLLAVQEATSQLSLNDSGPVSGFKVYHNGLKSKSKVLPEVQTFHADESSVTLEEVNSVEDLVNTLERIEPPSQLVAGLKDPLLQKFLSLRTSPDLALRLEFWLQRFFEEEIELLQEGFGLSTSLPEILSGVLKWTEASKELHPVVEKFFMAYLPVWDGGSNLGVISDILSYLPPRKFQDIYASLLSHLEQAILGGALSPYEQLFDFYTKLIRRWIEHTSLAASHRGDERQTTKEALEAIQSHVSTLIASALVSSESTGPSVVNCLDQISVTTTALLQRDPTTVIPIVVPQTQSFYLLLLSSSLFTISRLCAMLARYYKSILSTRGSYTPLVTSAINTYLMDTCNLLYRARAFISTDTNAVGCLCPRPTFDDLQLYLPLIDREYSLATMFGFSWHPLMSSIAHEAFLELETASEQGNVADVLHNGPVSQRSLVLLTNEGGADIAWKEYRIKVMKWMTERGLGGIEEFLFGIIPDLSR